MFNTSDDLNILLYSSHVKKYCSKNQFDDKCTAYYEDIMNKIKSGESAETLIGSRINNSYSYVIVFLFVVLAVAVFVYFLLRPATKDFVSRNTRLNESITIRNNITENI